MCDDARASVLSPGDVKWAQQRYDRKDSGSLVGAHGMCAAIAGASQTDGAPIMSWFCNGNYWHINWPVLTGGIEQFRSREFDKCLTVQNEVVPSPVVSQTCERAANQRVILGDASSTGVELSSMGGLCVEKVGDHLESRPCNASSTQRWDLLRERGSIAADQIQYLGEPDLCLTIPNTIGELGDRSTVATCSLADERRRSTFPGKGLIAPASDASLCLAQSGDHPIPGEPILLWNGCNSVPTPHNHQFTLHGRVRTMGACLTPEDGGVKGSLVHAQACNASDTTQEWDYFL